MYNAAMDNWKEVNEKYSVVQNRKGGMWELMATNTNRTVARYSAAMDTFTWVGMVLEADKQFLEAWVRENCK
jgi:hypothetical protein